MDMLRSSRVRIRGAKLLMAGCLVLGAVLLVTMDATGMIASTALGRVSADLASRVASPVMQFGRGAQHFMKYGFGRSDSYGPGDGMMGPGRMSPGMMGPGMMGPGMMGGRGQMGPGMMGGRGQMGGIGAASHFSGNDRWMEPGVGRGSGYGFGGSMGGYGMEPRFGMGGSGGGMMGPYRAGPSGFGATDAGWASRSGTEARGHFNSPAGGMMGRPSALDRLRGYGGGGGGYGEPYGRGNYVERPYGANSMIRQRMGGMEYERGYGSAGMGERGYGSAGMGERGYGSAGMGERGYGSAGMGERGYGSAGMGPGMGGGYGYGQRSYGDKYSGRPGADGWQGGGQRGGSERSWHEREQSGGNARYPWTAQSNRQGMSSPAQGMGRYRGEDRYGSGGRGEDRYREEQSDRYGRSEGRGYEGERGGGGGGGPSSEGPSDRAWYKPQYSANQPGKDSGLYGRPDGQGYENTRIEKRRQGYGRDPYGGGGGGGGPQSGYGGGRYENRDSRSYDSYGPSARSGPGGNGVGRSEIQSFDGEIERPQNAREGPAFDRYGAPKDGAPKDGGGSQPDWTKPAVTSKPAIDVEPQPPAASGSSVSGPEPSLESKSSDSSPSTGDPN